MYTGLTYAGTLTRPAPLAVRSDDPAQRNPAGNGHQGYFRTISQISHGSLASAYQAMKAHDLTGITAGNPVRSEPAQPLAFASGSISSGRGIPSAMSAYAEVMEDSASE